MSELLTTVQVNPAHYPDYELPAEMALMLETAVRATLQHEAIHDPVELSIVLTGSNEIRELNRDYLGYDKPTDVLSFSAGEPIPGLPADVLHYLGDIIIAVPVAAMQASEGGHQLVEEIQLLTVHGMLHLLGFDHATPEEKAEMWAAQTAVLHALGLSHVTPTEA